MLGVSKRHQGQSDPRERPDARLAQTNSQHPQLRAMQRAMVKAQSRESAQMGQRYRNWYGTP